MLGRERLAGLLWDVAEESSLILIWVGIWNVLCIVFDDSSVGMNLALATVGLLVRSVMVVAREGVPAPGEVAGYEGCEGI